MPKSQVRRSCVSGDFLFPETPSQHGRALFMATSFQIFSSGSSGDSESFLISSKNSHLLLKWVRVDPTVSNLGPLLSSLGSHVIALLPQSGGGVGEQLYGKGDCM